jgi:DNA topoisomerase-1
LFHELTKNAILKAVENPEALNRDKYEAQQARRILDRLVGYQVSPAAMEKSQRRIECRPCAVRGRSHHL